MTSEERLRCIQDILGFGDPTNARIAIIGYEEGGFIWGKDSDKDDKWLQDWHGGMIEGFVPEHLWLRNWAGFNSKFGVTERMQLNICRQLVYTDKEEKALRTKVYEEKLLVTGNLYSFGKKRKNENYSDKTKEYFGLEGDMYKIREHLLSDESRWVKYRKFVKDLGDRNGLIIFMALDDTEQTIVREKLFPDAPKPIDQSGREFNGRKGWRLLKILKTNPVCCFVQHPSYGWFNEAVAKKMVDTLKAEGLWT